MSIHRFSILTFVVIGTIAVSVGCRKERVSASSSAPSEADSQQEVLLNDPSDALDGAPDDVLFPKARVAVSSMMGKMMIDLHYENRAQQIAEMRWVNGEITTIIAWEYLGSDAENDSYRFEIKTLPDGGAPQVIEFAYDGGRRVVHEFDGFDIEIVEPDSE